jgi:hypothetical protein
MVDIQRVRSGSQKSREVKIGRDGSAVGHATSVIGGDIWPETARRGDGWRQGLDRNHLRRSRKTDKPVYRGRTGGYSVKSPCEQNGGDGGRNRRGESRGLG